MAAAAQQALPGEALYPVKRGLEEVRADLTSDDAARGRTLLQQADSRLAEVRALLGDPATTEPAITSTLGTYRAQAEDGSALLLASYVDGDDAAAVSEVRAFTRDGLAQLDELSTALPPDPPMRSPRRPTCSSPSTSAPSRSARRAPTRARTLPASSSRPSTTPPACWPRSRAPPSWRTTTP